MKLCFNNCILNRHFHIFVMFIMTVIAVTSNAVAQTLGASPIYEPQNPSPLSHPDIDRWSYVSEGLHGSVGSLNVRYQRDLVPMFNPTNTWSGTAWKGEKMNLQLVLWSNTAVWQVRVLLTSLMNENKQAIKPENIQANFVRYVLSDDYFYGCRANTQKQPPILVADILDPLSTFDMPAKSTRPVWITITVPPDANPGTYHGKLIIQAKGDIELAFELNLEVLPLILPPASDWHFELDLWQNPWAVARYHDVRPWSEEHVLLLKPLLKMLAAAGQKYVTTTIIHHPWNAQTYDPYETMIEWIKNKDGQWRFDYSIFDKWVKLCMEFGIHKHISCYSMICFRNNNFRYYDLATGNYEYVYAEPGTPEYNAHWRPFLMDFTKHLDKLGWLEKTSIAMDERPYELMKEIIGLIHTASPRLKITLASEDWQEQLHHEIFSYSVSLGRYTQPEIIKERTKKGLISTFYPCCVEQQPNNYPHSNPAESVWMGWLAAADGFSGFLRWAYNSWVASPLYDTRYSQWNAGECFLVYPGPRSSIRFERLREGIQDYEKIQIIREKLTLLNTKMAKTHLAALDEMLSRYSYQNAQKTSCAELVKVSQALLITLSHFVAYPQD